MKKENRVVRFVKEHKTEIAFISVAAITGITFLVIGSKKKPNIPKDVIECVPTPDWRKLEDERIKNLDWELGTLTDLWNEYGCTNAIINDVKVGDLGALGKECMKIENVTNDTGVTMVIGFLNNDET